MTIENQLEDRCGFFRASREQRKTEIARGLGTKGTKSYEEVGCYKCNGENRKCPFYYNPLDLYLKGLSRK